MFFDEKPDDFDPEMEVVSCFIEYDGEILLLLRQDHKPYGDTWGMPAGKVEDGESKEKALKREIYEETNLEFDLDDFSYFDKFFVEHNERYVYHIFYVELDKRSEVEINPEEHKDYAWFDPEEAIGIGQVPGLDRCIEMFYGL